MKFEELIRLKALHLKQLQDHGTDMDGLVDSLVAQSTLTRNICAHIGIPLFDEVENLCQLLDISKRRFVESALVDACQKASAIVSEVAPFALEG